MDGENSSSSFKCQMHKMLTFWITYIFYWRFYFICFYLQLIILEDNDNDIINKIHDKKHNLQDHNVPIKDDEQNRFITIIYNNNKLLIID